MKDFNDTLAKPANIYNYPSEIIETLPGTKSKTNRFGLMSKNGKVVLIVGFSCNWTFYSVRKYKMFRVKMKLLIFIDCVPKTLTASHLPEPNSQIKLQKFLRFYLTFLI